MNPKAHRAGTWLAFSAGMFAESVIHAGKFTDEQLTEEDVKNEFLGGCGDAIDELGVDHDQALSSFDKGRQFMAEMRSRFDGDGAPAKGEDGPPLLTPKPDRRLS